ncbi:MAG: hypothetical protein IJ583_07925 [Firmicutes bacterium]|nr:hypothetical protein [Bacillota bacterium]
MKKSKKNRLLSILLGLAMVLTLLSAMSLTAYAETISDQACLTFTAEQDSSSVTVK